jgi:fatty acid desaturase
MNRTAPAFRDPAGLLWHGGAFAYALLAWSLGLAGLFADSWAINLVATLLLAHGMIIAAYLIHECAHNTVFRDPRHNEILGELLGWIAGSAYGTFEDIRFKHLRHHVDNDDLVWFDYAKFFERHPLLFRTVKALEWLYIPAHDLVMYTIMMFTSFIIPQRRDQRRRNVTVLAVRGGLFLAIALASLKAALLWSIACLLRIHVLRFTDMLQHDYSFNVILFDPTPSPTRGDRDYEQAHTFSNPVSLQCAALNWLTLNFGFHNAHHARPTTPWFRLPALHRELFGDDPSRVIPFRAQLGIYHRHRVKRIMEEGELPGGAAPIGKGYLEAAQAGRVYGGNAASFLTSF